MDTERQRHGHRETETDRQTDDGERGRERHTKRKRQRHTERQRLTEKDSDRQTDRQTDACTDANTQAVKAQALQPSIPAVLWTYSQPINSKLHFTNTPIRSSAGASQLSAISHSSQTIKTGERHTEKQITNTSAAAEREVYTARVWYSFTDIQNTHTVHSTSLV